MILLDKNENSSFLLSSLVRNFCQFPGIFADVDTRCRVPFPRFFSCASFGLDQVFVFLLSFHLRAHQIDCPSSQALFSPACQKPPMQRMAFTTGIPYHICVSLCNPSSNGPSASIRSKGEILWWTPFVLLTSWPWTEGIFLTGDSCLRTSYRALGSTCYFAPFPSIDLMQKLHHLVLRPSSLQMLFYRPFRSPWFWGQRPCSLQLLFSRWSLTLL